jgi:hypothetical protein
MSKIRFADQLSVNSFGNVSPEAIITASGGVGNITFTKANGNQIVLPLAASASNATALITASANENVLTFTFGDLSTFDVTIATGSGGGGGGSTNTGSLLTTGSVSGNVLTFTKGDGTSFIMTVDTGSSLPSGVISSSIQISELGFVTSSATASFVTNSQTSSMSVLSAQTASYVLNAVSSSFSSFAVSASYAISSSHEIIKEVSSSHANFADTASKSLDNVLTASVSNNTITFTKGDNTTFNLIVDTGSGEPLPSGTVSSSTQISELGFVTSSATASFVTNSQTSSMSVATASFVQNAVSSSFSSFAISASYAVSASVEIIKEISSSHANNADTASYVENSQTASYIQKDNIDGLLISSSAQISSDISGAFGAASASFSTRVTNLKTDSGSFSTRVTTNETSISTLNSAGLLSSSAQISLNISGAFGAPSASFSTRVTSNEASISSLNDVTSSFVTNSQTSSMSVATASYIEASNINQPFTNITSSVNVSASGNLIGNQLVIGGGTFTSASLAAGGSGGNTFPYTGSALITGSLSVTGSINATSVTSSFKGNLDGTASTASYVAASNIVQPFTNITSSGAISASIFKNDTAAIKLKGSDNSITLSKTGEVTGPSDQADRINLYAKEIVLTDITASANISASGKLFANVTDSDDTNFKTVIYDPVTGQFYRTGSYGGGGGSVPSGTISSSTQISELGFINQTQTSSMSVATASFVQNAVSSSFAISASYISTSSIDGITNYIDNSKTSSMSVGTASIADTASIANFLPFNGNRSVSNQDQPEGIKNVNFEANGLADFIEKVYFTNTPPTITIGDFTIAEFLPSGSTVGTVTATDPESGSQNLTFSTSSDYTADQFRIHSGSGVVTLNVKSTSSMNTVNTGSSLKAPFPVVVTDTFNATGSRTVYIRVTPNTPPIWSETFDGTEVTAITESILEASSAGTDKDRYYFRDTESDTITIGSGSFSPHFTTAFALTLQSGYVRLDQITASLDYDTYPSYSFVLTASDEHYESGDDTDSIAYLPVLINVTDNVAPTINPQTLGGVNESSSANTSAGNISANDSEGNTITISQFQLVSAYLNSNPSVNLTSSLGGTSLTDPSSNPFQVQSTSPFSVTRKTGQFLNVDIADRYVYKATVRDDYNPVSASADITIPIANHNAATLSDNWTNVYIIESARSGEFFVNSSNGYGGSNATWSTSGTNQRWNIESTPDFAEGTVATGSSTVLRLKTNLSGSATTAGDSLNIRLTASQDNFDTTIIEADQSVTITAMTPPQWNASDQTSNLNTNGARGSANLVLASVSDVQSYGINHSTFTFTPNAGQDLEAVQNGGADSYYVRPTANLAAGTYGYTASIFNDRGFTAGELKDTFSIAQAGVGSLTTNGTFYVIESALTNNPVVLDDDGRTGTTGSLGVNYGGTGYNGAAVQGFTSSNATIAIASNGNLTVATNISGSGVSPGDTLSSNITWNDQYGNAGGPTAITINIANNSGPTGSFSNASPLQAPLGADTKLVDVTITDTESDTPFSMSLGGASASSLKAVPTNAVSSSYEIKTVGTVSSGITFTYNATIRDNFGKTRTYTGNTVEVTEAFPSMYIYTITQGGYPADQNYNNITGISSEDGSTPPVATIASFGLLEAVKSDGVLGDASFNWNYGSAFTATRRGNPQVGTVDEAISGSNIGPQSGSPTMRAYLFVPSGSTVSQVPTSFLNGDPSVSNTTPGQYVMFISNENVFQNSTGGIQNDIKVANVNKITIDTAVDGFTDWLVYGTDADFVAGGGNLYWRFIPANAASGSVPT